MFSFRRKDITYFIFFKSTDFCLQYADYLFTAN